ALTTPSLADCDWNEIAAIALRENSGRLVDVPTGHGFCLLIKQEILTRIPHLNEAYGKGYGEENELCLRSADLGWRHVAALGAFVEHRESVSFGSERAALVKKNLAYLEGIFPEYS